MLDRIQLPLFSSGVWGKMQLHTRGNIDGYLQARGQKKLRMSAAPNAWAAAAEYASEDFHRAVMLPFYDQHLKGIESGWSARPAVEYFVRGSTVRRTAATWPPDTVSYREFFLSPDRSGSVHSLNDGSLLSLPPPESSSTQHVYPNPGWVSGVVGFGPRGPASGFDPARRVLTFTSTPLETDLEIAGPIRATLYASSSATDTDFFLKLSDQAPDAAADLASNVNPTFEVVSRGWLRASHRALDPNQSTPEVPVHAHDREQPLVPNAVYAFEISLEPQAYRFAAGHRIRLEISNGDSPITEALWPHFYRPDRIGTDQIHHGADRPSCLVLPVNSA
jgi:putative CocE/NonD family hydrolase